ncbi:MAG: hypothetical protein UU77_C0054G0006 [candidate division WWE3 bacterium GW2011_GWC1_41_7]|nr:MAG: hypothetical protein UU72_C0023G0002 [candidate division WWE3 bacterium GW2011_GWB1_41_6]KKS19252.1 MAG: hypothetical protein UU77_C0054G0006 [candidate division WWE3 bacterium GW2011_GWC1_41_7]KKS21641.1 MAG: hypothetical protein UU80_C0024G0002 [candidate division WWE3 bacterium GW2011_GWA1_41_8]
MPLILIIVVLVAFPVGYYFYTQNINSDNVKGMSADVTRKPGFGVEIVSLGGTWDLVEFLCTTLEECTKSAVSGKRSGSVSGGTTQSHEVVVQAKPEWKEYQYIKYLVRPGWSSVDRTFKVLSEGSINGTVVKVLKDGLSSYETVITPVSEVLSVYKQSAIFSDN